jgi:hypothetical protein
MDKRVEIDQKVNEKCRVPCRNCGKKTNHSILKSVDVRNSEDWWGWWDEDSFQIVQCLGCDDISFRKVYTNSENIDGDPDTGETWLDADITIYPSRIVGRNKLRQVEFLPWQVARIYDETHAALCSKQPILAGIGIRALVEAVCQQEQASGKTLEQKIDNLVKLEVLTKSGAEMFHSTRLLGNVSAHEVKPHSEVMLNLAMDVVEHLLTNVYILPEATSKLPKRKKSE